MNSPNSKMREAQPCMTKALRRSMRPSSTADALVRSIMLTVRAEAYPLYVDVSFTRSERPHRSGDFMVIAGLRWVRELGRVRGDAFADEGRPAPPSGRLGGVPQLQHRDAAIGGRLVPGAEFLERGEIAVDRLALRQLH